MVQRCIGSVSVLTLGLFDRLAEAVRTSGALDARACCRRGICPLIVVRQAWPSLETEKVVEYDACSVALCSAQ